MHKKKSERMLLQTIVLQIKRLKEKKKKERLKQTVFLSRCRRRRIDFAKLKDFLSFTRIPKDILEDLGANLLPYRTLSKRTGNRE